MANHFLEEAGNHHGNDQSAPPLWWGLPMPIASVVSNDSTASNPRPMATLTIRNLDDAVRDRLRRRAAEHGHSMEEEVRQILRQVVEPTKPAPTTEGLGSRIHNHFARLGGVELELPARNDTPTTAPFEP